MLNKKTAIKYFVKTYLLSYIAIPLGFCSILLLLMIALTDIISKFVYSTPGMVVSVAILLTLFLATAFFSAWLLTRKLPQEFNARYAPALVHLASTMLLWAMAMLVSGGFYGHLAFYLIALLQVGFWPVSIFSVLSGYMILLFLIPLAYDIIYLLFFLLLERKSKDKPPIAKKFAAILCSIPICCGLIGGVVMVVRAQTVLPPGHGFDYGNGYSSVDISHYRIDKTPNKLAVLDAPSKFIITDPDKMPILDGAEAAFPVYSAFANACYKDIKEISVLQNENEALPKNGGTLLNHKVPFSNTIYAFESLVKGKVDIFFGAEPSKSQRELAARAGKELVFTPIGKEAFVFFVAANNTINDMSTEKIKEIYSGKVKNWSDINGADEKIWAFQRPENSGSQTIMQKIMGDTKLAKPLKEERISGMGGATQRVSDYRNYPGAIGYSFRFFATGMVVDADKIKLLSINGIEPSDENIRSGAYPYSVNLFAVTIKDNKLETVNEFLTFMLGKQGQELVRKTGYVTD